MLRLLISLVFGYNLVVCVRWQLVHLVSIESSKLVATVENTGK